jgi:stage III sporulation protein AA
MNALKEIVLPAFPPRLTRAIELLAESHDCLWERISELRVRADRFASLTVEGKNLLLPIALSPKELSDALLFFCHGSLYAHTESIAAGFVSIGGGCRVGIAGRAVVEGGRVVAMRDIASLSVRLARRIIGAEQVAYDALAARNFGVGMLVYSKPGVGKTTLLRELARRLSIGRTARRVALIDSRGELDAGQLPTGALVDVLVDFPKGEGIERAIRTLSPELLICDEIGSARDAEAILSVQYAGVPLIASAHGDSPAAFAPGTPIASLLSRGVFGLLLGIERTPSGEYRYLLDELLGSSAGGVPCDLSV